MIYHLIISIYNILRIAIYLILLIVSLFNKKLKEFFSKRLFQNLDKLEKRDTVWVHCASVGEVNLSEPLVKKLREETGFQIIVTMMTDTGMKTALEKYQEDSDIKLLYFPVDDYLSIKKILNRMDLKELVIVETEIWPNLIELISKKTKISMINGRISDKSIDSYLKIKWFLASLFEKISLFLMQSKLDSERVVSIGANSDKVKTLGNLKFDINFPDFSEEEKANLKQSLNPKNKKIFIAGSTRDDEEEFILEVFEEYKEYYLLILVPRHIERCDDIVERLLKNYRYDRYSKLTEGEKDLEILLVDEIGLLRKLYSISDIAFVGGTMVNIGGHSLLEPLYYGLEPIFGKYNQNIKDISQEVVKREIGYRVEDTEEFIEVIKKLEKSQTKKDEIELFFSENSNVLENTYSEIKANLT